jgi:hypothetical protein
MALVARFSGPEAGIGEVSASFIRYTEDLPMSTKTTLKFECDETTRQQFHLYNDLYGAGSAALPCAGGVERPGTTLANLAAKRTKESQ